ncbi:MAG: glycosyltransferase family 2 protein [Candidatus Omnitrophica bacterium]|nr:glycosyltransferase family 2 protein [Candidatus Omnitrophota bacterium]
MRAVMPKIKKEWYDQMIVVDGGSTDGSLEYAQKQGYEAFVQQQKGFGAAYSEAVARSTGDILIMFSPDGNSMPEKLPELTAKINEGYDMVIASRYAPGAKSDDDDPVTAFGNWMFTALFNVLFHGKITDSLVMYRAYRKDMLLDLKITTRTVSWGSQILARALKAKKRIAEIPADEPARIGGVRKMSPIRNGLAELSMIFQEWRRG